jgi:hypothetical protein
MTIRIPDTLVYEGQAYSTRGFPLELRFEDHPRLSHSDAAIRASGEGTGPPGRSREIPCIPRQRRSAPTRYKPDTPAS